VKCTDGELYLLCNIILTFVIFTLVKTKLPHYTLPAFPLLACLFAPVVGNLRATLFAKLTGCMVALNLVVAFLVSPLAAAYYLLPIKAVTRSVKLAPETEFASVDYDEPSQIWYFRSQLKTWHVLLEAKDVAISMSMPGPRLCVIPAELAKTLPQSAEWEERTFCGKDLANGKVMSLTMILKRR